MNKKLLLLAFLSSFYVIAQAQNDQVTLFEQCNYGGNRYTLGPGSYPLNQMKISNDRLSSIMIPNGMKVTIYEDDNFGGRSRTYNNSSTCLENEWRNMASSIVIEREKIRQPGYNQNDFVTIYNDCNYRGFSQVLHPGNYTGSQLGASKYNISSFTVSGNLMVRVYINNENLSGNSTVYETDISCLQGNQNDRIGSLSVEYKQSGPKYPVNNIPTNTGRGDYATVYADCYYRGNSLRLAPGFYQGDKLGLLRYNISSIQIPSNLSAKVYLNNENMSGNYYTLTGNTDCLSEQMNDRIGSLVIEEYRTTNNPYNNGDNDRNNHDHDQDNRHDNFEKVVLYADKDFKGQSVELRPGSYRTMAEAGFIDKALSSIVIPPGYRVILYDRENFRGSSTTLTASREGLGLLMFNDKTSSIVIIRDR